MGLKLSEREVAHQSGVSRMTLRSVELGSEKLSLQSCGLVAQSLAQEMALITWPHDGEMHSEYTTVAVGMKVQQSGFESWKLHFFELVDEFRRTLDPRLILLPPPLNLDSRLRALLASITLSLCDEAEFDAPNWASRSHYLDHPWFISGVENLRAMAILESPVYFRKNNIFVLENFLRRA